MDEVKYAGLEALERFKNKMVEKVEDATKPVFVVTDETLVINRQRYVTVTDETLVVNS